MTCKDCIHSGLCYKENEYNNFSDRCGDFIYNNEKTQGDLISRSALKDAIETYDKFACLPDCKLELFRNLEHPEMFEPYVRLRDILNAIDKAKTVEETENLQKAMLNKIYGAGIWKQINEGGKQ